MDKSETEAMQQNARGSFTRLVLRGGSVVLYVEAATAATTGLAFQKEIYYFVRVLPLLSLQRN